MHIYDFMQLAHGLSLAVYYIYIIILYYRNDARNENWSDFLSSK